MAGRGHVDGVSAFRQTHKTQFAIHIRDAIGEGLPGERIRDGDAGVRHPAVQKDVVRRQGGEYIVYAIRRPHRMTVAHSAMDTNPARRAAAGGAAALSHERPPRSVTR